MSHTSREILEGSGCYPLKSNMHGKTHCGRCCQVTPKHCRPSIIKYQSGTGLRLRYLIGCQVAARLDSLMRASLETTAPGRPRSAFHRPFESSGDRASTQTRVGRERQRSLALDNEALEAAAREFLTRRCAASLSQTNHVDDIEQRLSEALVRLWEGG